METYQIVLLVFAGAAGAGARPPPAPKAKSLAGFIR